MIGLDMTVWALQIVNFLILAGWPVLAIVALMRLRHCRLDDTARVLWVIVRPGKPRSGEER